MASVFFLLGANLGNRREQLAEAERQLERQIGPLLRKSRLYESEAWGTTDQPAYYNQVLYHQTALLPEVILTTALAIEARMGRVRQQKWEARQIDIDVLYYDQWVYESARLSLPHPLIALRRFALMPLAEVAPDFVHPVLGQTQTQLLEQCPDILPVQALPSC
ncbi:MAG: 2-amino-4-hydroxy-6-hydroxymethyldihydropteridine diphosphokinase [Microscillaceae bacterium]|nr:2-amino-4-hydroxy-6-hydroxymethyldihydropteridine diphosphokinase [Microscillaceae bacterium]